MFSQDQSVTIRSITNMVLGMYASSLQIQKYSTCSNICDEDPIDQETCHTVIHSTIHILSIFTTLLSIPLPSPYLPLKLL